MCLFILSLNNLPFALLAWCGCSSVTFYLFRLTYDATLAELTSLEEMMRSMMDDGQIHHDVIAKLWQVYSSFTYTPGATQTIFVLLTLYILNRFG
jgi:hypothetical protein